MSRKTTVVSRLIEAEAYVVVTLKGKGIFADVDIDDQRALPDVLEQLESIAKKIKKALPKPKQEPNV